VSAIEFALLLPLMLTLYLGGMQLSDGIAIDRKVTLAARTVADLTSQVASTDSAGVSTILDAATQVMSPYADNAANAAKLMVRVSVIKVDAELKTTIEWSKAKNGSKLTSVTVPPALLVANTYLVLGEAKYAYTPPIGYVLTGTLNLDDQIFMRPRLSTTVVCPTC
jgi:Flp pilus assembly protein TadG